MNEDKKLEEERQIAPDDQGNLSVEGHIRIFNPETGEEFVNGRDL